MANALLLTRAVPLLLGINGALAGCESFHRGQLLAHNEPLRAESLQSWAQRELEGQPALRFALDRLALIFDGIDDLQAVINGNQTVIVIALRNGHATGGGAASAVAITNDGYFLTAAHCVEITPFMIVARGRDGVVREALGRIVWSGPPETDLEDVAIVHAAGFVTTPVRWTKSESLQPGMQVLGAGGLSTTSIPLAGGTISGRPIEIRGTSSLLIPLAMPLVPGDSGGPIFAADGSLVGVMVSADWQFPMSDASGSAIHPDPEFLASVIEHDRGDAKWIAETHAAPNATESFEGNLMLTTGGLRVERALRQPALSQ